MNYRHFIAFFFIALTFISCTQETVTPKVFGNIEGMALTNETNEGIPNVNITTTPATSSILTNPDGSFELLDIPTGQYNITAEKLNFETKSISVMVEEDRFTTAKFFLKGDGSGSGDLISADVTSWNEFSRMDTTTQAERTFINVEFRVRNNSSIKTVNIYEVYFRIYTNGPVFFKEIRDSSLAEEEVDFGQFQRSLETYGTDSVKVIGTWNSDN